MSDDSDEEGKGGATRGEELRRSKERQGGKEVKEGRRGKGKRGNERQEGIGECKGEDNERRGKKSVKDKLRYRKGR